LRHAAAVATACAFAGRRADPHELAQRTDAAPGGHVITFDLSQVDWGEIEVIVSSLIAGFSAIFGVISVRQICKRNQDISPMVPISAFLAAFMWAGISALFAAATGDWVTFGVDSPTGPAPSITGTSRQAPTQHICHEPPLRIIQINADASIEIQRRWPPNRP